MKPAIQYMKLIILFHNKSFVLLILLNLVFTSCQHKKPDEVIKSIIRINTTPRPIDIYPYAKFSDDLAKEWQQKISKLNPKVTIKPAIALYPPIGLIRKNWSSRGLNFACMKSVTQKDWHIAKTASV